MVYTIGEFGAGYPTATANNGNFRCLILEYQITENHMFTRQLLNHIQ